MNPSVPPPALHGTLLLIDDEERILRSLAMLFRGFYKVYATTNPQEALAIVEREPVHVIISDQRMPLMRGADLLREVRLRSPLTLRLLLTGYSELDAIVASVNEGEIFRFITKPWEAGALRETVAQAMAIAQQQQQSSEQTSSTLAANSVHSAAPDLVVSAPVNEAPSPQLAPTTLAPAANPEPRRPPTGFLVIDDDQEVWQTINDLVGSVAPVHLARNQDEAFAWLDREHIGVVVSELIVAGQNMTAALKLLKANDPALVTIVMTPFQDTATLIGLINQGQVFRLLPKPVRRGPLGMSLSAALRQHHVLRTSPSLQARHAVEPLRAPEELSVASRVMGLIGRLRKRSASNSGSNSASTSAPGAGSAFRA